MQNTTVGVLAVILANPPIPANAPGPLWALTFPCLSTSSAPIKQMSRPPLSYRSNWFAISYTDAAPIIAPKASPDTGNPPIPPDSTVSVIISRIPFFLAYLDTISGRPIPIFTMSSTRSSLAALLPIILPATLFLECFEDTVSIFSFQVFHSSYGISKLPVNAVYASLRFSGSATTIASTRHPGMIALRGRDGVSTRRSTCTITLPRFALTAWQIDSASPDINISSNVIFPLRSAAVPLINATVIFGSL